MEIGKVDRKVGEGMGAEKSVLATTANVLNVIFYPCQTIIGMAGHLPS